MTDFIRRLVSLDKARYRDDELDIDLDLVYITKQVVVMGYPASGLEALYRNRREDAKRFLEHRHGQNFWVFNFCPVAENSYPPSVFDGRVSRYPFPDHHAPPLAVLALIAREIRAWLAPSPERIAVLHCKAGKGRSGTMACAYLLTSDDAPSARTLDRTQTTKAEATSRAQQMMDAMPSDDALQDDPPQTQPGTPAEAAEEDTLEEARRPPEDSDHAASSLARVLALHTAKRMKRPSSPSQAPKQGVSIPSQRRWLRYWALLIAHQGPPAFWAAVAPRPAPKVRLTHVAVRMRELAGVRAGVVRAANALLTRTGYAKASRGELAATAQAGDRVWVSLARYDDALVGALEDWERHTRDAGGNMGRRRPGSERRSTEALADVFRDDRWDQGKMVRPFARLGVVREEDFRKEDTETEGTIVTRVLRPLTDDRWGGLKAKLAAEGQGADMPEHAQAESEDTSIDDVTHALDDDDGIVLDAHREVRLKLYIGQVFMGWCWFVPTFHMPHPRSAAGARATLVLARKELDFPIGVGVSIVDVAVGMEWVPERADVLAPPSREGSLALREERGEPTVLASSLQAVGGDNAGVVDTRQAAED